MCTISRITLSTIVLGVEGEGLPTWLETAERRKRLCTQEQMLLPHTGGKNSSEKLYTNSSYFHPFHMQTTSNQPLDERETNTLKKRLASETIRCKILSSAFTKHLNINLKKSAMWTLTNKINFWHDICHHLPTLTSIFLHVTNRSISLQKKKWMQI